jgi:hypothetical protein
MASINKRLLKRHKRQVLRAKEQVRLSEPDLRTPEQIKAARDASRPDGARTGDGGGRNSPPAFRKRVQGTGVTSNTEA